MNRLTDDELREVEGWAIDNSFIQVLRAVREIQERRTVDRNLVNSKSRNQRWTGQRRRK